MPGAKIVVCLIWRQWITGTMASSNLCWQIGQDFPDQDFKSEVSCNLVDFRAKNLAESMPWIVMHIKPGLNSSERHLERRKREENEGEQKSHDRFTNAHRNGAKTVITFGAVHIYMTYIREYSLSGESLSVTKWTIVPSQFYQFCRKWSKSTCIGISKIKYISICYNWVNVCSVCATSLSEPLPHYNLFFGQS